MNGKSVMIGYNRRDPKSVRIAEEICAELTVSGFAPLSLKYDDGGTGGPVSYTHLTLPTKA